MNRQTEKHEEVIRLLDAGKSIDEIAERLKYSTVNVYRILRLYGRNRGKPHPVSSDGGCPLSAALRIKAAWDVADAKAQSLFMGVAGLKYA